MKLSIRIILKIVFTFIILETSGEANCQVFDIPKDKWVNVYSSYQFENNESIDSVYLGWIIDNMFNDPDSAINICYKKSILKIDPIRDDDEQVVIQFIKMLDLIAKLRSFPDNFAKINQFRLSNFFSPSNFKKKYVADFNGERIELVRMNSLKNINEIEGIQEEINFKNKSVTIKVGKDGPMLKCSFKFYYATKLGQNYTFFTIP